MATATDICNSFLLKLGAEAISSLDEDSKYGRLCKEQYPKIRKKMIASHPWNFAMKRATLAISAEAPEFGFDVAYILPADCLRAWQLNTKTAKFKVEKGRLLLTNLHDAKLLYISLEEDESKYSPQFSELLAWAMVVDLGYNIVQDKGLMDRYNAKYQEVLRDARSSDGQEGTPDNLYNDAWLQSRQTHGLIGPNDDQI